MARKSYEYRWDGDKLIVRYKGSRYIKVRLGNAILFVSPRITPKKYSVLVTGRYNARKGILPNSQSKISGRWGWLANKITIDRRQFKDDFNIVHDVIIPKLNNDDSFNYKDEVFKYDGAVILNDLPVLKHFW